MAVWTVKDQKCEKFLEDAETIETTKDGVCTFYPAEKTVYDPLVSEWDSAEETVPVYYERTADGFAECSYRELTASEYLTYVSAEDSDEEAQAWKEKLEEQFYTQTDENTEYTYWFYAIGEDKIAYRCREAGQSVGQEEGIDHAVAKYSWCISSLDQGKLTRASETISGDGFFFPSRLEQEEALESLEDIPNEFTKNRLNKVQKTARATVGQAVAQILEVQEYPDDALCFAEAADYDGNGKKKRLRRSAGTTERSARRYATCGLSARTAQFWKKRILPLRSWKSWEALLCCIVATKCPASATCCLACRSKEQCAC